MVWINNRHYNAKSYPREAYGGARCVCVRCRKSRRDVARLNIGKNHLQEVLIRMADVLTDDNKCAGGPWQDDVAND
jgi:hypothetical protein